MKIFSKYKPFLMLAATLLLAACSADEPADPAAEEGDFEGVIVNISRPAVTRADNDLIGISSGEGDIKNLTVLAFPTTNGSHPEVKHISTDQTLSDSQWTRVPVRLPAGSYNIYVMANVDKSILYKDASIFTSADNFETALKGLTEEDMKKLNISAAPFGKISDSKIPMSCHASAIKWKLGNTTGTGAVTIQSKKTTTVYATLIFAMAKVRYTLYNGKAPFLKMTSTAAERVQFSNYATRVGLIDHLSSTPTLSSSFGNAGDNGQFYKAKNTTYLDKKENGNEPGPAESDYTNWADTDKLSGDADANTWVYQGIAYVPEYLFGEDSENPTKIKFSFAPANGATADQVKAYSDKTHLAFGGEDTVDDPLNPGSTTNGSGAGGAATHHGVIRGLIYDVLIFTTEKDIALQVRVKPWAYSRFDFEL